MRIRDLPAPVTASKADWLAGGTWLGFTPISGDLSARSQCQSTVSRQFGRGYVIEYVTEGFGEPNPDFLEDETYLAQRERHRELAGCLVAVYKLRPTWRPLEQILTHDEYKHLQDVWAKAENRFRWSVAFPIVESYRIVGHPKAKAVLGEDGYHRLYQRSSATLRTLDDQERAAIADLEIELVPSTNSWIGIEDEIAMAEGSQINVRTVKFLDQDLDNGAPEGMTEERWAKVRCRAAWLADKFIRFRQRSSLLRCDQCGFDPATRNELSEVKPRSLLDVHHKCPLEEGRRYTTPADFALLCPTCHRIEHALLRLRRNAASTAPRT